MADAPRLLTPEDVDESERMLRLVSNVEIRLPVDAVLNFVHTLRAAWGEIAELAAANDGAQSLLTQALRERDDLKAAMKISAAMIEHIQDERDDARRQLYTQAEQREITDALTTLREQRDAARTALSHHATWVMDLTAERDAARAALREPCYCCRESGECWPGCRCRVGEPAGQDGG